MAELAEEDALYALLWETAALGVKVAVEAMRLPGWPGAWKEKVVRLPCEKGDGDSVHGGEDDSEDEDNTQVAGDAEAEGGTRSNGGGIIGEGGEEDSAGSDDAFNPMVEDLIGVVGANEARQSIAAGTSEAADSAGAQDVDGETV
ncbi:hypothetical protein LTS18_002858 [Coniosporium uncinatum]|uniref:Uncharacterized protein n=1 Tax=Coniosporium uncinatum TaxID=93489 RepID=A0ACC3DBM5_9PEZI|nr:hypothetical protein LTS18_002858 [Coniosporium uncinatum]